MIAVVIKPKSDTLGSLGYSTTMLIEWKKTSYQFHQMISFLYPSGTITNFLLGVSSSLVYNNKVKT